MVDFLKPPEKPVEMTPQLLDQITGWRAPTIVHAGLAPYMHLPSVDPKTIIRARMAEAMARAMAANNCVTEQDLATFSADDIREHRDAALRIAGVAGMAI